jgi:3-deoxy-D-manno-octulosonate 8-phosphate phosphatase (KDO 8-P phosphatase)
MSPAAVERAAHVWLMIFDVDGVLTDASLVYNWQGETNKRFNTLDGYGLKLLSEANIATAMITARRANAVILRAKELGMRHVCQGVADKRAAFEQLCDATGLSAGQCGYMGDDWPDLPVLKRVGFAAAPASAHSEVRQHCHWVAQAPGGQGAVRELCDFILRAQGCYKSMLSKALA